ncbi:GH25 family lysozyme [Endozoicomonas sp. Mp262]|uniref:glycoside hydrolase family 25 protein n=1 Tax=Endozoicomonas sp. Mp262 TaxID=2919499 RepID=UPI0021D9D5D7
MLDFIKRNHKLLYTLDGLLVLVISGFIYKAFIKTSEQDKSTEPASQPLHQSQGTAPTSSNITPQTSALKGIDVSHYQGEIQWLDVASQYHFAFIKATEGTHYIDPKYQENIRGIISTDILYGAYHFFSPDLDPIKQAEHFISATANHNLILPPVLDVEVEPSGSSHELRTAIKQWLTHVEKNTGCRPVLYTNKHFWNRHLNNNFENYPLWISDYTTNEKALTGIPWEFWQYTEQGQVQGVSNPVDENRFYGDLATLNQLKCS